MSSTHTVLYDPHGLTGAELPLYRAPYEALVTAVLAWKDPHLEPRDYEQIALQLTGHARAGQQVGDAGVVRVPVQGRAVSRSFVTHGRSATMIGQELTAGVMRLPLPRAADFRSCGQRPGGIGIRLING
ncbi:hypothetical protein [Streptomyces sp. NEAU-L66]|uniref:hypothetical protein n=1 Tax=Streptomyces sp. NEAU-L66 TaxID=3390812 RepID=UPI0039C5B194